MASYVYKHAASPNTETIVGSVIVPAGGTTALTYPNPLLEPFAGIFVNRYIDGVLVNPPTASPAGLNILDVSTNQLNNITSGNLSIVYRVNDVAGTPMYRWNGSAMQLLGWHDTWDDLRFPSQSINPPGTGAPPSVSATTGMLEFSGTADNFIFGVAQMPHSWIPGTTIKPHVHLRFPTSASANTVWRLDYDICDGDTLFTNAYGTYITTLANVVVANPTNVLTQVRAQLGDISMTNFSESACIMWKLSRLATNVGDTDVSAVVLLEFDIHFQSNKPGTITLT